jgi:hypothetical protein
MNADLAQTAAVFDRMEADGLNTSEPLKWGFFFTSNSPDALDAVWDKFADHEYSRESTHQADDRTYVLQVSKIEALTAERLHRRNVAFNELADFCGPVLYDGWDVGRVG